MRIFLYIYFAITFSSWFPLFLPPPMSQSLGLCLSLPVSPLPSFLPFSALYPGCLRHPLKSLLSSGWPQTLPQPPKCGIAGVPHHAQPWPHFVCSRESQLWSLAAQFLVLFWVYSIALHSLLFSRLLHLGCASTIFSDSSAVSNTLCAQHRGFCELDT